MARYTPRFKRRVPDPNKVVRWRGVKVTNRLKAFIRCWEDHVGVTADVYQGSFNPGGVGASGGTHDEAGASDTWFPGVDPKVAVIKGRNLGGDAWYRHPPLFPLHIHCILPTDRPLSPAAQEQTVEYAAGGDGLIGSAPDEIPYRPAKPVKFDYYGWHKKQDLRRRLRGLLRDLNHATNPKRQIRVRKRRRELRKALHDTAVTR